MKLYYIFFIVIAFGSLVLFFVSRLASSSTLQARDDYRQKYFLSKAELSFFRVLASVLPQGCYIFSKVRLADLFTSNRRGVGSILKMHLDFLVCDEKLKPLFGVELDDSSHSGFSDRDNFKDYIFASAGLPLLRVRASLSYDPKLLNNLFSPYI